MGNYSLERYVRDNLRSVRPLMRKYKDFSVNDIAFGPGPDRDEVLRDLLIVFSLADFVENGLDVAFEEGYEDERQEGFDEGHRDGYFKGLYDGEKKTLEGIIAALT